MARRIEKDYIALSENYKGINKNIEGNNYEITFLYEGKPMKIILLSDKYPFLAPHIIYNNKTYIMKSDIYTPLIHLKDLIDRLERNKDNFTISESQPQPQPQPQPQQKQPQQKQPQSQLPQQDEISITFQFDGYKQKTIRMKPINCKDVVNYVRETFKNELEGKIVDSCVYAGKNLFDRPGVLYDGMIIHIINFEIMGEEELIQYIKNICTTNIQPRKMVSTPPSGFIPRILYYHYTTYTHYNWENILYESFGQENIKIHAGKIDFKKINSAPILFYHDAYLSLFADILHRYDNNINKLYILNMLQDNVEKEDIYNMTIINVVFGDIAGVSGFPKSDNLDHSVIAAYMKYMELVITE
jgi:hypothetical protein